MYNTKFCKVEYLNESNAILLQWKQFCKSDDYRDPFRYALKIIKEYNISTWVTDTINGFENEEADTKWLLEEYMPQLIDSPVKKVVFVIKDDSLLMDEIMGQVEVLREFFEVELVEDFLLS